MYEADCPTVLIRYIRPRKKVSDDMTDNEESISLTVEKSIPSDVGHGRARISGDCGLDLKPGKLLPCHGPTIRSG